MSKSKEIILIFDKRILKISPTYMKRILLLQKTFIGLYKRGGLVILVYAFE